MTTEEYIKGCRSEFEAELKVLVEMPTVSMEPERATDIRRCAEYAAAMLRNAGFDSRVCATSGYPIVVGEYIVDPNAPTVMIYNHLDVQPADKEKDGWRTEPFVFTIENGKYFGRGATDDKGPALSLFFAARYAMLQNLPLNFQFVWEFEEEDGSKSFHELFGGLYPFSRSPDVVVVCDGLWRDREHPAVEYGLRGNICFSLVLKTADHDTHSGATGGFARNPLTELCGLISRAVDVEEGIVKIPDAYRRVRVLDSEELKSLTQGFDQNAFKKAWGLRTARRMTNRTAVAALKLYPTFEVLHIFGGYDGPGFKTVIPHQAEAKISMRLVPDQDPEEVLQAVKKFVAKMNPDVEVHAANDVLRPYVADPKDPYFTMLQRAVEQATGKECPLDRAGGSIGAVSTMAEHLGTPIALFGLSLPEHGYHAPNEYFEWPQVETGIRIFVEYFRMVSSTQKRSV